MTFTAEQFARIKAARSIDELITLAGAERVDAGSEQIMAMFMPMEGELSDNDLGNVAGGTGYQYYDTPGNVTVDGRPGKVLMAFGIGNFRKCVVEFADGTGGIFGEDELCFMA